jgi:DNA-binding NtrC family response regulator
MTRETILFIEDDKAGREMGAFNLKKAGFEVDTARSGEEGLALFDPGRHDVVVTDVRMPGISGFQVLETLKQESPDTPVLVITAYADVEQAVLAMKLGAYDFIGKPFHRDHLLLTLNKALERRRLKKEVEHLRVKAGGVERPIVFASVRMKRVLEITDRTADSRATLLITGESGTGKELIARRVHVRSPNSQGPFIAVNTASLPSELLESELFGHEKGAYTGATSSRIGRFRSAQGGRCSWTRSASFPCRFRQSFSECSRNAWWSQWARTNRFP